MELVPDSTVRGFHVDSVEDLPEIDGTATIFTHRASGARLLYLKNADSNKAFSIGFRTPPQDDTGVFHILEHSVLCGSDRYPVKEPFVDLLKGSMQTFLNAMTFADKTMYPVASTNEQDLFNLMGVYLDAVFHPQIYHKRTIFEQEGWHYELIGNPDDADARLVYNGVVFNEMKGALSDSDAVLYDELQKALLPTTAYAFESGGTPQGIPTLTYENYLDEHRRHYRTDNSYLVLYGDIDIDRALAFLDSEYLTPVAEEQARADKARIAAGQEPLRARALSHQDPVCAMDVVRTMDTTPENACAGMGFVIGENTDRMRVLAASILLDALFGSNEAPLKRALLDAGVADDVTAFVSEAMLQPFFIVSIRGLNGTDGSRLPDLLTQKVTELLDAGLDNELIEASLSHAEFITREHDMGVADGVVYAISALSGWLYDDEGALTYLRYEDMFAQLRENLTTDYFAKLCRELFLDNQHRAFVRIVPATDTPDANTDAQLAAKLAVLSQEDRQAIVDEEGELRRAQMEPDAPEAVATLPHLTLSDIGGAPAEPSYALDETMPVPCLRHAVPTHGLVYVNRYFDEKRLTFDDFFYVGVLALVLGKLGTKRHTAAEIDTLTQGKLGNLSFYTNIYGDENDAGIVNPKFVVSTSALSENCDWAATLPVEIMLETDFSDHAKIKDVLQQRKIGMEQDFANAGHSCALSRVRSYYSTTGVLRERISNVDFYRELCKLLDEYDERAEQLEMRLASIAAKLFADDGCTMGFAGADDDYERFWAASPLCNRESDGTPQLIIPAPVVRNEAFIVPTDICFAAQGFDRRLLNEPFTGTWGVASRAVSFSYLWNEVRVKGGAYGVGFHSTRNGDMRFYSYRDPHLDETLDRFAGTVDWLSAFNPSQEEHEGYIVASTAANDAPVKARELIARQAGEYFTHLTREQRLANRDQMIATSIEDVRACAPVLAHAVDHDERCVFGNKDILNASQKGFEVIELIHERA